MFLSFCRIADAEENLGESEVREAHLAKSLFYIKIGDMVHKNLPSIKIMEVLIREILLDCRKRRWNS